jgi:hypothetical protein
VGDQHVGYGSKATSSGVLVLADVRSEGSARKRLLESRTYDLNNLVGIGQDVEPRRKIF